VPIVNENDTRGQRMSALGDNDTLSALVAVRDRGPISSVLLTGCGPAVFRNPRNRCQARANRRSAGLAETGTAFQHVAEGGRPVGTRA